MNTCAHARTQNRKHARTHAHPNTRARNGAAEAAGESVLRVVRREHGRGRKECFRTPPASLTEAVLASAPLARSDFNLSTSFVRAACRKASLCSSLPTGGIIILLVISESERAVSHFVLTVNFLNLK